MEGPPGRRCADVLHRGRLGAHLDRVWGGFSRWVFVCDAVAVAGCVLSGRFTLWWVLFEVTRRKERGVGQQEVVERSPTSTNSLL